MAAWGLAPSGATRPGVGLVWLLFVGSSVHVVSTGWLLSAADVRSEMWSRRRRYVWVPLGLVSVTAALTWVVPAWTLGWVVLAFFGWQFWHFQRQNLGLVALAAVSHGARSPGSAERGALIVTGVSGTLGLLAHPRLLQLAASPVLSGLFPLAVVGFALGVVAGFVALAARPATRQKGFCVVYVMSLLFFLPVFVFGSPYAAVGGLTIAHGLQYLLLVGLVAIGDRRGPERVTAGSVMLAVALVIGAGLSTASHLHSSGVSVHWLYGVYLGVVMSHFVVDAGIWRLSDPFPRRFLMSRVPFLVPPARPGDGRVPVPADGSAADIA